MVAISLVVLVALFFGANTTPPKVDAPKAAASSFDMVAHIAEARTKISTTAEEILQGLEDKHKAIENQKPNETVLNELAGFWKITGNQLIYAYYCTEAAQIVNTDSAWGFAGDQHLKLFKTPNEDIRQYVYDNALTCFQKANELNPDNHLYRTGLAKATIEGKGEVMEGVQLLLGVVRENPDDVPANLLLGKMSIVSGQYEKAVKRLEKVTGIDTTNLEAFLLLSEAYNGAGQKQEAINTLNASKTLRNDPKFIEMINEQIKHISAGPDKGTDKNS